MIECFDCNNDVILTDVIHKQFALHTFGITFILTRKTVQYTCRMCGQKWYVDVGIEFYDAHLIGVK